VDGKIYVVGGTADGRTDLSRVDRFDPATNSWDTVAPLPWPRSAIGCCAYQGQIYAIAGFSQGLGTFQRTVARFTPDSGAGQCHVMESLWYARAYPAAAVAGNWVNAVGGKYFNNNYRSFEFSYGGPWVKSGRLMKVARSGAAAVGWGDWLCAIGGWGTNGPLRSVEMLYVPSIDSSWDTTAQLSMARAYCGAAIVDGFVVVIGGRGEHGAEPSVERNDAGLFPGVEEPLGQTQPRKARGWATVASDRVRIACRSAVLYDGSGRRVFAGPGPVDVTLTPGVYFARVSDEDGSLTTGRLAVLR